MAKRAKSGGFDLKGLSTAALEREIARRASRANELRRKRDALLAQVAKLDAQLRGAAPAASVARRGRPPEGDPKSGSLAASLHALLKGKQMGVTEAAEAVKKAGYKTNSDNFRTIVNACLIKHKNLFRKVKRGKYTSV